MGFLDDERRAPVLTVYFVHLAIQLMHLCGASGHIHRVVAVLAAPRAPHEPFYRLEVFQLCLVPAAGAWKGSGAAPCALTISSIMFVIPACKAPKDWIQDWIPKSVELLPPPKPMWVVKSTPQAFGTVVTPLIYIYHTLLTSRLSFISVLQISSSPAQPPHATPRPVASQISLMA